MSRHGRLALLVVVVVCATPTCVGEESYTSPFTGRLPTVGSVGCVSSRFPVDTFVLDVFEYVGPTETTTTGLTQCAQCMDNPEYCVPVTRVCRCSGARTRNVDASDALVGLRVEGLDDGIPLCVRLVGLSRGTEGSTTGPAADCAEDPICAPDASLADASFCTLSELASLSPAEVPIQQALSFCPSLSIPVPDRFDACRMLDERCEAGSQEACAEVRSRPMCNPAAPCAAFGLDVL